MSAITPLSANLTASLSDDLLARQRQGQGQEQAQLRSGPRPELAPQLPGALQPTTQAEGSAARLGGALAGAVVDISAAARQRMLAEQMGGAAAEGTEGTEGAEDSAAAVTVIPGQPAVHLPGEDAARVLDDERRAEAQSAREAAPGATATTATTDAAQQGSAAGAETPESAEAAAAEGAPEDTETETGAGAELDPAEQAALQELKARDREVRQHEQAHLSAAGSLATGGPTYSYQRGPDGRNYAIGGEVGISLSPGRTPQETIVRAERIAAAALAPAEPSGQDRAVAARAMQMKQAAMVQAAQEARQSQQPQEAQAGQDAQALPETDTTEATAEVVTTGRLTGRVNEAAAQDAQAASSAAPHARQAATAYAQVQQLADAASGRVPRRGSLVEMAA